MLSQSACEDLVLDGNDMMAIVFVESDMEFVDPDSPHPPNGGTGIHLCMGIDPLKIR